MPIGTLTVGENVDVDFICITSADVNHKTVRPLTYEPQWDEHSTFLAKFNNTLLTGNLQPDGTAPTTWAIYRQRANSEILEHVTTINGAAVVCYDYMPSNDETYIYHSFALTGNDMSEDMISAPVTTDWDGWKLITLEQVDDERFIPHEIFTFQYNLELGDMSNNTTYNKLETFTAYPFIQRSSANHMSGQLKSLLGVVNCATGELYDTLQQAEAIRALSTSHRRKILKDLKGHVFEVELSNSILFSVQPFLPHEPYAVTIAWTEIADTDGMHVVATADEHMEIESSPTRKAGVGRRLVPSEVIK